jgi:hypothetical protein
MQETMILMTAVLVTLPMPGDFTTRQPYCGIANRTSHVQD